MGKKNFLGNTQLFGVDGWVALVVYIVYVYTVRDSLRMFNDNNVKLFLNY